MSMLKYLVPATRRSQVIAASNVSTALFVPCLALIIGYHSHRAVIAWCLSQLLLAAVLFAPVKIRMALDVQSLLPNRQPRPPLRLLLNVQTVASVIALISLAAVITLPILVNNSAKNAPVGLIIGQSLLEILPALATFICAIDLIVWCGFQYPIDHERPYLLRAYRCSCCSDTLWRFCFGVLPLATIAGVATTTLFVHWHDADDCARPLREYVLVGCAMLLSFACVCTTATLMPTWWRRKVVRILIGVSVCVTFAWTIVGVVWTGQVADCADVRLLNAARAAWGSLIAFACILGCFSLMCKVEAVFGEYELIDEDVEEHVDDDVRRYDEENRNEQRVRHGRNAHWRNEEDGGTAISSDSNVTVTP